jgi:hypothetical protein
MEAVMPDQAVMPDPAEPKAEEEEKNLPDPAEPKAEAEEEKKEVEEKPVEEKKNHDQRRWERVLKERAEYKAKADLYEQMNQQQQKPANTGRPEREKFASDEEYVDALTDWKIDQKLPKIREEFSQTQRISQQNQDWGNKIARAKTEYPDYEAVMEDAMDIPITPTVSEALQSSDFGADLAYYLAKNPQEAQRLNSLPPVTCAREIGRIESYLEYEKSQAKEKTAVVSKAPVPIKPGRNSTAPVAKSLESMTPSEYMTYMNKREQERRKKGRF